MCFETHIDILSEDYRFKRSTCIHIGFYSLIKYWVGRLFVIIGGMINPLNSELNTICHLLALLGAHHIFHVSRIRVKRTYFPFSHIILVIANRTLISLEKLTMRHFISLVLLSYYSHKLLL
jgi:hypothetical protein